MHLLTKPIRGKKKEEGMRRRTFIAAFAAVAALAGCSTLGMLGGFKEPVVTFKDLRVAGLGLNGDVSHNLAFSAGLRLDF